MEGVNILEDDQVIPLGRENYLNIRKVLAKETNTINWRIKTFNCKSRGY